MKILKFENTNPLLVLHTVFVLKFWTIFLHEIWIIEFVNFEKGKKMKKTLPKD